MKKYLEYWPLYSLVIILLSSFKVMLFFGAWNIEFEQFASLKDMSLQLIKPAFLMIMALIYGFVYYHFEKSTTNNLPDFIIEKQSNYRNIVRKILCIICAILFIAKLIFLDKHPTPYSDILINVALGLFCLVYIIFAFFLKFILNLNLENGIIYIFGLLFGFIFTILLKVSFEVHEINKGLYSGTVIETKEYKHISTEASYYVGQSNNSIFIFNTSDSSVSIIPVSEVTFMKIKTK
jgi:hypothetical protein